MTRKAKKRGNGEGSIDHMKDGRWRSRISVAPGKQHAFFGTTRAEAAEKLAAALADRKRSLTPPEARHTPVRGWVDAWLTRVQPSLKPRVWTRYEQLLRLHLLPSLGGARLSDIRPQELRDLYERERAAGSAPQSIVHLHVLLHQLFDAAIGEGFIASNPTARVKPPRVRRHEIMALSAPEAQRLIAAASSDRLGALYVVAVTTGMRQGELLALRWSDIDLDAHTIQIRGSLQRSRLTGLVVEEPKTRSSRRQVRLTALAAEALRQHKERQQQESLPGGVVFASQTGSYIEAGNMLRRSFRPLLERAGLPPIRFHDLRHTAATLMLAGGVHPKVVSEMLGHTKISVTLDLYSHALPTIQAEAVRVLDGMLS